MPYLHYYARERALLPESFTVKLDDEETTYIYGRLQSHYGFRQRLRIAGWRGSGYCNNFEIRLSHNPSVGLMAHEIGHAIHRLDGRSQYEKKHTKKHFSKMKRVAEYALAHLPEYRVALGKQRSEREQRLVERVRKLEQQTAHKNSPQGKLEHLHKLEAKWVRRQRLANTRLKKIRRRIRIWEKKAVAVGPPSPQPTS